LIPQTKLYSRQGLWSLFLVCAFAPHAWTILLALRDFSWVTERTNSWDAVGNLSYGLVFAFLESGVVFLAVALLGLLVSQKWGEQRRVTLMGMLALVAGLWAIAGQLYFMLGLSLPESLSGSLARSTHPLRWLYAGAMALVLPTVLAPALLILRSERVFRLARGMNERLALLSSFYLILDVAGLVVLLVRNLG
jgi:hypothetical protein